MNHYLSPSPAANHAWPVPVSEPVLGPQEVHIWRVELDQEGALVQRLWNTLASDEAARAERLHFPKDRRHFIVARGLLRLFLGRYLSLHPAQIRFRYNAYGKPALNLCLNHDSINFNVSHSSGLALYAFARNRAVGIDLEVVRGDVDCEQIAERFFSAAEHRALQQVPAPQRRDRFFTCWTRKEAYAKAHGEGLALPFDQFSVSIMAEQPAQVLSTRWDPLDAKGWSLYELRPGAGYVATLAARGHPLQLRNWQYR